MNEALEAEAGGQEGAGGGKGGAAGCKQHQGFPFIQHYYTPYSPPAPSSCLQGTVSGVVSSAQTHLQGGRLEGGGALTTKRIINVKYGQRLAL